MMPQERQVPDRPPDPGEALAQALERHGRIAAVLEEAVPALLARGAAGDGHARALHAALVVQRDLAAVMRDLAAKVDSAMVRAAIDADLGLRELAAENARLRAELEAARARPARRGRHASGERPLWPRAVRTPAFLPAAAFPAALRHAGSTLGQHAASAAAAGTAVAASAALIVTAPAGPAHAVRLQGPHASAHAPAAAPYSAVRIPPASPVLSSPARPAAASASPVPRVTPSPAASPQPSSSPGSPPSAAPAPPALDVPRFLDLGAMTRGPLTITAGPQAVPWTLSTTDGIQVLQNGVPVTAGTLAAGQELDLTAWAPAGRGWIYVSFGATTVPVQVTSDLAPS